MVGDADCVDPPSIEGMSSVCLAQKQGAVLWSMGCL